MEAAITDQRAAALAIANERRFAAAEFKADIRALGRVDGADRLASLLEGETPDVLQAMVVYAALQAVRGIGHTKASFMLRGAGVFSPDRRVRDLTDRQRKQIARAVRLWA